MRFLRIGLVLLALAALVVEVALYQQAIHEGPPVKEVRETITEPGAGDGTAGGVFVIRKPWSYEKSRFEVDETAIAAQRQEALASLGIEAGMTVAVAVALLFASYQFPTGRPLA